MRTTAVWVTLVVLVLGLITLCVRLAEPKLAFFPRAGEQQTPKAFGADFTAHTVTTTDGERLRVWHLPRKAPHARVVYFHGNGGNLSLWADILAGLWVQNFDVVAVDYRGYGLSTGSPSERGLYRDVEATIELAREQLPRVDAPLVYWGRSLGTPMAAYAASKKAPDGIVLESGFPTMKSVIENNPVMWFLSMFSSYSFPTAAWMSSVREPTLVLHGERDSIIPHALGTRLYEALPGPKKFVTLPGLDHNDDVPAEWPVYWDAVKTFVASLRKPRS
jgi:fermentation-respiration switch protein FrsA (DUF1100 family)